MKSLQIKRRFLAMLMVVAMLCAFIVPASAENKVANDKTGVLQILTCYTLDDGNLLELATGTCFLIADNAVLTSYHVLSPDSAMRAYVVKCRNLHNELLKRTGTLGCWHFPVYRNEHPFGMAFLFGLTLAVSAGRLVISAGC